MDVDWRTGNVYFIDNIKKHIAACTASGSRCIEVLSLNNVATSIALAPKYGYVDSHPHISIFKRFYIIIRRQLHCRNTYSFIYSFMFWSVALDEEYGYVIKKAHMNGIMSLTFLEGGLRDVSVISIDEAAGKLYWLDAVHRKILVAGFDSSNSYSGRQVKSISYDQS